MQRVQHFGIVTSQLCDNKECIIKRRFIYTDPPQCDCFEEFGFKFNFSHSSVDVKLKQTVSF